MKNKKIIIIIISVLIIIAILLGIIYKLSQKENQKKTEYNIYIINATLPLLFSDMNIIKNSGEQTYLWYSRVGTLNNEFLEEYSNLYLSEYIGLESYETVGNEAAKYVSDILKKDKNAHFNLYVDECRAWLEFPIFLEQGLKDSQYNVNMYSDGTLSYVIKYDIMKENSYELFKKEKENYFNIIEKVRSGELKSENKMFDYLKNDELEQDKRLQDFEYEYDANYMLLSTLRENVRYYLQYPELIEFKDEDVAKEMSEINLERIDAKEIFSELSSEEKDIFYDSIYFDKEEFDEKYFDSKDSEYLIITGTKPLYGNYTEEDFEELIKDVIDEYGKEYKILYKPHPSAVPDDVQMKFFENLNIKVLPGKMPMEAISFVYPNLKVGGFASSLYMSVEKEDTLFFFENDKNNLVEPLNILYDSLFYNAKFIKK